MITLFPSEAVDRLVEFSRLQEAIRSAHVAHALGQISAPGRLDAGTPGSEYHVKVGENSEFFVVKANSGFFSNPPGRPAIQGGMLVFESRHGTPVGLVHSGRLTALRTASASCVAVQALRTSIAQIAIIGTGTQAIAHRQAIVHTYPGAQVLMIARGDWMGSDRQSPAEARDFVASSDVVITATPARSPLLDLNDVRKDALIVAVGADAPGKRELTDELMRAAAVVVDLDGQARAVGEAQHLYGATADRSSPVVELGAILAGIAPPPMSTQLTVYDSTGTGFQDAAAAASLMASAPSVPAGLTLDW